MKKILNILIVLVLMISISSLALAEEADDCTWHFDEGTPENECNLYCNNSTFENISMAYSTFEECEECRLEFLDNQTSENETEDEIEIMNNSLGAEIRLLQLEKAITKNILKGEMTVDVLKGLGYNTADLEAILAEMRLVLEEVQNTDPYADDAVKVFVDLKSDARELTKEFRITVKNLLANVKYREIKEQIQQMSCEQNQNFSNLSKKIRNRVKQFNRNQLHRLYDVIGEKNETIESRYENGTMSMEQVKIQLNKKVNNMANEKKKQIFKDLRGEKVKKQIQAQSCAENASVDFAEREQTRLNNRLQKAEKDDNIKLKQQIQTKITNKVHTEIKSNNAASGNNVKGKNK